VSFAHSPSLSRQSIKAGAAVLAWVTIVQIANLLSIPAREFLVVIIPVFLLIVLLAYPSPVRIEQRILIFFIVALGIFLIQEGLPVLAGPDERAFHHVLRHQSLREMQQSLLAATHPIFAGLIPARISFPVLLKGLIGDLVFLGPAVIAFANTLVWTLASFSWVHAVRDSQVLGARTTQREANMLFLLLLILPSAVYWSSVFAKDVVATALTIFAATAAFRRHHVRTVCFIALATLVRPYAIVMVVAFYLFLNGSVRLLLLAIIFALLILFVYSGGAIAPLANVPLMTAFMFLSPNPLNLGNWAVWVDAGTWEFSPILFTAEAVILSVSVAGGTALAFMNRRDLRTFFLLGAAIVLGAIVLTLVGYFRFRYAGYGIGMLGDNMVRKKFGLWPLIVTWMWLAIIHLRRGWALGRRSTRCQEDSIR
jgi:hypothetical protein